MKLLPLLAGLVLSALPCLAAEFDLGAPGMLSVDIPAGWSVSRRMPTTDPSGRPAGYTLLLTPDSGANAKCWLNFLFTDKASADRAAMTAMVQRASEPYVKRSVEKKADMKDFALGQGFGVYCVLTDSALVGKPPKADDYKVLGNGQIRPTADVLGIIGLFADDAEGPEFQAMIKLIESIQVKSKGI